MPAKGQPIKGLCYIAWDTQNNRGQTGDSAQHQLQIIRDGITLTPYGQPYEIDGSGSPGLYALDLTAEESNGDLIVLAGRSLTPFVSIIPVQLSTQVVSTLYSLINPPASTPIWTDGQIEQWQKDALNQIAIEVNCVWAREIFPIKSHYSTYRLPNYVRTLELVTYRGKDLQELSWSDYQILAANSIFNAPNSNLNIETYSIPQFYVLHPTNTWEILFYPTPSEDLSGAGIDPYSPSREELAVVIQFWRTPDLNEVNPKFSLPAYIERRLVKAYVMWRAFSAEGKGQDLGASAYYKAKFDWLIAQFRIFNQTPFISTRPNLQPANINPDSFRPAKPSLGSNFERTRLR